MKWSALLLVAMTGCEFADVDTGETGVTAPDLVGTYASELTSISGCDGLVSFDVFDGPLVIAGEATALTFAWGEFEASGTTDASSAVAVDGTDTIDDTASVTIDADGLAVIDAGGAWLLDLGVAFEVEFPGDTGSTPCSASGSLEALQQSAR